MGARRRRKYIASLKREDSALTWDHGEKEEVLHDYFSGVMGTKVQRSRSFNWERLVMIKVEELPGLELDRPFTEGEVEFAVKSMPNDKAPRPNGFTTNFYKRCWQIIRPDIMAAFHSIHIHHSGPLEHINGAQIVLLPKTDVALEPRDFRPISLIHSFAKLVTKTLALRLGIYIDELITNAQSAFIKRQCIQGNCLYVRGLARHYHRTKTPACLIKLDISKAFDTVSWEYMIEMMVQQGFSHRWTDWLAALFSSSSSAVLLNGCPRPKIRH